MSNIIVCFSFVKNALMPVDMFAICHLLQTLTAWYSPLVFETSGILKKPSYCSVHVNTLIDKDTKEHTVVKTFLFKASLSSYYIMGSLYCGLYRFLTIVSVNMV